MTKAIAGIQRAVPLAPIVIAVLMLAAPTPAAGADQPPLSPRDVYAEAPRADQVVLTWRRGAEPPPGEIARPERYEIFRDGVLVASTEELRFVDSWLLEQRTYAYTVRALDASGAGAESAPVTIATPSFSAGLELAPYLQQLTPTGAAIVWQTFEPANTSLQFGPSGGALEIVQRDDALRRDHVVVLSNLTPGTSYTYRWQSEGRIGPAAEFRTPRASADRFTFGAIGDFGIDSPAARSNLSRLRHDQIDFAITTGDNAQLFGTELEYRQFVIGPLHDLIAHRPFWPSIGNHDLYGLQNYLRYFALPNGERYYSFTYAGVLFVSLDSNWISVAQKRWLKKTLAASGARCKVAYFHHPLWSSGRGYHGGVRTQRRHKLVPILQRGGVDLVLNGHVQNYERSHPLRSGHRSRRGIVYVVTGGGGARLNGFVTRKRPRWSARRGIFHHRLRITAVNHKLRGKAIDTGGSTRDRFVVPCR